MMLISCLTRNYSYFNLLFKCVWMVATNISHGSRLDKWGVVSISYNGDITTSASSILHVVANHRLTVDGTYYVYMHLYL